jgi:Pyruvate/2-oxoacid:ferredoxin oxidoreductase gamma subunit
MAQSPAPQDRVNDFVIKLGNVNGTGSASANSLLMKSIFRMGIPVMGKNYFPSNIQGLPTWYEIRVSKDGYVARSGKVDIMLAMNAETYRKDHAEVATGGYLVYDSTWPRSQLFNRADIHILGVPLSRICNENFDNARSRILMKNIMYVGVLAALLDLDMNVIKQLLNEQFAAKASLLDANQKAIDLGFAYAQENFSCPLPFRARTLDKTRNHIMIDGNTTAALGCLFAGVTVVAWYPITPSSSVIDALIAYLKRFPVTTLKIDKSFVDSLANGTCGYVPLKECFARGGYEPLLKTARFYLGYLQQNDRRCFDQAERTGWDEGLRRRFGDVAEHLALPRVRDGVCEQHRGYFDLPDVPPLRRGRFNMPVVAGYGYEGGKSQMNKQADVVMMHYLFEDDFDPGEHPV